jgi:16S rRNA (cytidine1402-2'-O)-methyltransferase
LPDSSGDSTTMLKLLPTPIGNLQDITLRTLEELKKAQIVFCEDTRITKRLLYLLAERLSIDFGEKRFISLHSHNEQRVVEELDISLFEQACVYVSDAGTPCISDPGSFLVRFCQQNGLKYEALPGASAVTTVYAASGCQSSEFSFIGFLPHKKNNRIENIKRLISSQYPVIFYEAPHRLLECLEDFASICPDRRLFLAKELTKMHEKFFDGAAKDLYERFKNEKILGEWACVVWSSEEKSTTLALSVDDIKALELPKKEKAKLICKITGENPKTIYETLI